ncbi:UDP-N-acetylmuramoyl-L-alanine--D-glutamate ligase [Bacillus cytotoxicus]|uniref:UDP-N-acetylmuramoylalanine--D-glutamate ligase n=1 Tax=Bacillus cytotoxicus (strain DSM 22905 / CIP 110041 / 391-98 / NVH 391-98) TaxID=315749 RepID=MURD_BACCN|nr:UDP-N-acetylmuramoyl-L-alanine--D-glutamate ligase [Bacillus cytotoxicus]A7GRN8.1 RecName: Full=UDP-N-acetylmuramoylalanine--D-glutamate ligase; AltName: Full=D-glutamic acid-adding enzyme; AltName: Full=UDP-N-acetylmuramoyl-L-alanyl-D-glutamate synthetase [Bacillus cytotoxicus NVH 391-98]ABS22796.1 UDP-N-acetylmuramoylalanine--D-glutamate ligase [Bacillus cytotoxicus NVH 391-98]MDH2863696.1 UDP-N-acetylmuramoyl-L-alanine--D-glutamate ligase [Bacillus cytotoxicus]MDH2879011.1 UDP-N-acetylmur
MKTVTDYQNKNILVLGIAKSGYAAANLLKSLGANVIVNDGKPLANNELAAELQAKGMDVVCGGHPLELLERNIALVVKNPGIPYSNPLLVAATEKQIPIITEIELAYRISEAPFIGITGSNGKTTTTMLTFEMLKEGEKHPAIAGNIGTVACEVAQAAKANEVLVTELSSFQLMGVETFQPKIAAFLNLFEAHLDYHGTKKEYGLAKANIFKNQTAADYSVINADDADVMELSANSKGQKILFSTTKEIEDGACIKENALYFKGEKVVEIKDIVLPGKHNLENILAAMSIAKLLGVANEAIVAVLKRFTGVKHRLEYVTTIHNRKFYNDSKATNILATEKALSAFTSPVILLAGGLDRGNEFDDLIPYFEQHVKAIVTYGQTAPKLVHAAEKAGLAIIEAVHHLEEAVERAYAHSADGDVILLSPACASWDQFKTFEERGDIFIQAVHKLI